ncbi:aldo/keto reductase [Aneurinibacillus sp. Ricciae_BoGa-3]|uniref:aldo/keto reductase n=1 Tax=Aneurinibacillus sp. Ricciae_BoGa-3 TaxID=3022697 RepID=UPI0023404F2F|nr:aldo/keto reductase [Aneurinibacillus sp. Ricciae_BoGa-3]WCK55246.1 aldo/keto reductase [Aneurinibacillus sp. Ricciae_BoGa-3]
MKKNQLGSSVLYVTEIGFGCMSIGTIEAQGIRLIHEALDQGINFLDTADLYDFGRNEEIVGQALKGKRQDVILSTKVGNRWHENKEGWFWDPSKAYIKEAVKKSLSRLQTDYIDLYQLHGGTLEDPIEETIEAFEELKQEGLIRYYGISSIRPNVIREYVHRSNIVSVMSQYSILDRRSEEEVLGLLQKNQISLIARGPVAKGNLSDKVLNKPIDNGYLDYHAEEIVDLVKRLKALSTADRSVSQIALRFALAHPAVATVIPGASRLEQVYENVKAAKALPLTVEEIRQIQQWSKANRYESHR